MNATATAAPAPVKAPAKLAPMDKGTRALVNEANTKVKSMVNAEIRFNALSVLIAEGLFEQFMAIESKDVKPMKSTYIGHWQAICIKWNTLGLADWTSSAATKYLSHYTYARKNGKSAEDIRAYLGTDSDKPRGLSNLLAYRKVIQAEQAPETPETPEGPPVAPVTPDTDDVLAQAIGSLKRLQQSATIASASDDRWTELLAIVDALKTQRTAVPSRGKVGRGARRNPSKIG